MKFIDPRIHLTFLLIIVLGFITYVRAAPVITTPTTVNKPPLITTLPVNKTQLCGAYEEAFIASATVYQDIGECNDLQYSLASFKQLIYTQCPIDKDYVTIVYYLSTQKCKELK